LPEYSFPREVIYLIILLSPAKTMNFVDPIPSSFNIEKPIFNNNSILLNDTLRNIDEKLLKQKMNLSDKLLPGVTNLIHNFTGNYKNGRQSIFAYRGAVYKAINSLTFNEKQMAFAQNHLRILSGLYGVLKPLDGIEEYRLEMKTKLHIKNSSSIADYWKDILTNYFRTFENSDVIINLASNEYSKIIDFSKINVPVINISFGEIINNTIKYPPMYSKMARGEMAGFIVRNFLKFPEHLKGFNINNYSYNNKLSSVDNYIFTR